MSSLNSGASFGSFGNWSTEGQRQAAFRCFLVSVCIMGGIECFARLYLRVPVSGCLDGLLTIFRCILKILPSRLIGLLGLRWLIFLGVTER